MMHAKPILFSGSMVRANIREVHQPGTGKTQTRRVLKPQPFLDRMGNFCVPDRKGKTWNWGQNIDGSPCVHNFIAEHVRYAPGDVLWVRETWMVCGEGVWTIADARMRMAPRQRTIYAADATGADANGPWWPSIHMPREFSRLTLGVTDVRVERLQDISEADALAEGVCQFCEDSDRTGSWEGLSSEDRAMVVCAMYGSAVRAYSHLWDTINGAGAWDANPWVVAVTYRPHLLNVDAFLAQQVAA